MEKDAFLNKSYCEFIIISEVISPDIFTKELNIQPSRSFCKGDKITSKYSNSTGKTQHNLWALQSEILISEEEDILSHINYFKNIIEEKIDIFRSYKADPKIEITFWIWIETEDAGIGLELFEQEVNFLNDVTNRIHLSFICKNNLT